ncbi:unnamed protein product [Tilletia caries]|nr:unnamed protein product [Tilletia caries]CAD7066208.1 unnamed protein product [Tilletia caries]
MSPATHSAGMKLKLKQAVVISLFWLSSSIAASVPAPGAGARGSSPLRLSKGFKPHSPSPAAITNMAEFGTVADQAMLVHDIIDRARANDNVIAVEDTHRFGNYSMRDALSYIDAFMDKARPRLCGPRATAVWSSARVKALTMKLATSLKTAASLIYGALTAVAVIGAIGYLPAAFYNRKAATFAAMTAAKLNENKYYWVVKNGEAIADGTLSVDGYSATYDACAGVGQDEAILVTRALSNSEAENHVDQIQQGFADIIGNLVDCGQNNGIGTLDAHGSWWVEFQIAGAQGCQQACGY